MIVMLDTPQDLRICSKELGQRVEQLFTPLTRYTPQQPQSHFAIDNGAFSKFEVKGFMSLLKREKPRRRLCRFVAVPDVVGSAIRTLEIFRLWMERLEGWPLALVAQDGQEYLPIPWEDLSAIFIGGSTEWKMSKHVIQIIKAAKALDIWIHVGRVNTPGRFEYFEDAGADSIDGTGLSRYSWMRNAIYRNATEPRLIPKLK
jgi:hypothetical protein